MSKITVYLLGAGPDLGGPDGGGGDDEWLAVAALVLGLLVIFAAIGFALAAVG